MSLPVAEGTHTLVLRLGEDEASGTLTVGPETATKLTWTPGEPSWQLDF
jgi:hypothetical protein